MLTRTTYSSTVAIPEAVNRDPKRRIAGTREAKAGAEFVARGDLGFAPNTSTSGDRCTGFPRFVGSLVCTGFPGFVVSLVRTGFPGFVVSLVRKYQRRAARLQPCRPCKNLNGLASKGLLASGIKE